jgi:hypothetical protein
LRRFGRARIVFLIFVPAAPETGCTSKAWPLKWRDSRPFCASVQVFITRDKPAAIAFPVLASGCSSTRFCNAARCGVSA